MIARPIATRCISPPDSSFGKCRARSGKPILWSTSCTRCSMSLACDARQRQRERDVLEDIQRRDEIEELENVAERVAPQHRQLSFIERRCLRIAEKDAAATLGGRRRRSD